MKKRVVFISMAGAVVLLWGGMLLVNRIPQQPSPGSSYSEAELEPLIARDTLPEQVTVTLGSQTTRYAYQPEAQAFGAVGYDPRLEFSQEKLGRLFASASVLNSREMVETAPESLAVYGLDPPAATVTAVYGDGETHTIRVGGISPLEDGRYGMVDDRPEVFLLLSYDTDSFVTALYDFRTPQLLPVLGAEEEEYAAELLELTLERKEKGPLSLVRNPPESEAAPPEPLRLTQPVTAEGDQYLITDTLVKGLFALMRSRPLLEEDNPGELSRYGLDAPDTLYLRDGRQESRLAIGRTEAGRTYVMREGVPSVLSVEASLLSFFYTGYEDVMSRLFWLHNINDIDHLLVEQDGRVYDLDVTEASAGRLLLDGEAVPEERARSLFAAAISPMVEGRLTPEERPGEIVCRLTMVGRDGGKQTLEFYPLNERQTALAKNGEKPEFYCDAKDLQRLVEALKTLI